MTELKKAEHKGKQASITVFLSLILLLILSFIFTIIEGARVHTARVFADRALTTAMDSVLAEYYGPLWEEYHLFGLYTGEESLDENRNQMEQKLFDYMSFSFSPVKDNEALSSKEIWELYDISTENITVGDEAMLMDYQGKLIINEAVEYMKYREIGDGLAFLLDKLSLMEQPEKVSYIQKEKQRVEKELVEIDKSILELMKLFDGLLTSKKGIEITKDGRLKTTSNFIKKICFEEATMESVGINHESVFLAQKNSYVNPEKYFDTIQEFYIRMSELLLAQETLREAMITIELSLSEKEMELVALNASAEKPEDIKEEIKVIKKEIKELKAEMEDIEEEISAMEERITAYSYAVQTANASLLQLISDIKPLITAAVSVVNNIIVKTETALPLIEQYEALLNIEKEFIGSDIFEGFEEELNGLKKYVADGDNNYDFHQMKDILEQNLTVLINMDNTLVRGEAELLDKRYPASMETFLKAEAIITAYRIHGLTLDYSTLVLDKSQVKDPLNEAGNLLNAGIMSLILDTGSLSESEISDDLLPSDVAALSKEKKDFLTELQSFFENTVLGESSNSGDLFGSFAEETKASSLLSNAVNQTAEHLLYQEYIKDHFGRYVSDEQKAIMQKPSVLTYEQEYLLVGQSSDRENLASVITRIIFLRTIFDFVSILGDKAKCNEAKVVASALVGFTGLTILVYITQYIILIVWAFAEALLDTCALMMGKEVPILKRKVVMELPELFLINRVFLQSKVEQVTNSTELSFSYQDYLGMFLLLKNKEDLTYLSLDLIQENIKLRYDENTFSIQNCLFGYSAEADFTIKPKFLGVSFMKNIFPISNGAFTYKVKSTYSY